MVEPFETQWDAFRINGECILRIEFGLPIGGVGATGLIEEIHHVRKREGLGGGEFDGEDGDVGGEEEEEETVDGVKGLGTRADGDAGGVDIVALEDLNGPLFGGFVGEEELLDEGVEVDEFLGALAALPFDAFGEVEGTIAAGVVVEYGLVRFVLGLHAAGVDGAVAGIEEIVVDATPKGEVVAPVGVFLQALGGGDFAAVAHLLEPAEGGNVKGEEEDLAELADGVGVIGSVGGVNGHGWRLRRLRSGFGLCPRRFGGRHRSIGRRGARARGR